MRGALFPVAVALVSALLTHAIDQQTAPCAPPPAPVAQCAPSCREVSGHIELVDGGSPLTARIELRPDPWRFCYWTENLISGNKSQPEQCIDDAALHRLQAMHSEATPTPKPPPGAGPL